MPNIRSLVENKKELDYKELTLSLVQEFGIKDKVEWDSVIPSQVQKDLFGGETLRLFKDHESFANQKDIRAIHRSKGETSQLLILSAILNDENLSKSTVERVTKKFVGGQSAGRYVIWFLGNPSRTVFKVVVSRREGKKVVLRSLPIGINQPFYRTYEIILQNVNEQTNKFFVEPDERWNALWSSFNLSVVNKKFYDDIKTSFDSMVNEVLSKSFIKDIEIKKHFTIRLIGRIIFCWFLKELGVISKDVLSSSATTGYTNYYRELLEKLFFDIFNTREGNRKGNLPETINKYPYLNGGLFEAQEDDFKGNFQLFIPNDWFFSLFQGTLEKYNFTIDENSSTSEEIAIDPEMLGRIFENLLAEHNPETKSFATDRKSTGSYYTPREIVDFMVSQSIIEFLKTKLKAPQNLSDEKYDELVDDFVNKEDTNELIDTQIDVVLDALNKVKIIDPACGSGAFAIGCLQKLYRLKKTIYDTKKVKSISDYEIKLRTIEGSIYGVDIQPLATELSRLRCWLSLIVDEKPGSIKPLPNLNFKFITANSLIDLGFDRLWSAFEKRGGGGLLFLKNFIDTYEKLEAAAYKYFNITTSEEEKEEQKELFKKLQSELAEETIKVSKSYPQIVEFSTKLTAWNPFSDNYVSPFFSSSLMFGNKEGFDIVIGNPPYIKEYTNRAAFDGARDSEYYQGKMDIWYLFASHFIDHLAKNTGILTFIATNNWVTNAGASKLRNKILEDAQLIKLYDFGSFMIFASASIQTMILVLRNKKDIDNYSFDYRKIESPSPSFEDVLSLVNDIDSDNVSKLNPLISRIELKNQYLIFGSTEIDSLLNKIKDKGNFKLHPSHEVAQGIVAPQEFLNRQNQRKLGPNYRYGEGIFILDDTELKNLGLSRNDLSLIRPYYTTNELKRYYGNSQNAKWIIYTDSSFKDAKNISRYPGIKKHLDRFAKIITSDNKPYGLHRSRDEKFFKGEKIISLRKCLAPTFTYVDFDSYVSQTFFLIKSKKINLKYLTALLNSSVIAFWLRHRGKMQGNNYQVDKEPMLQIPIIKNDDTVPFEILVDYIIELNGTNITKKTYLMVNFFENILDAMIYEIYFEESLHKSNKYIIKYLSDLPRLTHNSAEDFQVIVNEFNRLSLKDNPVQQNLYYLDSIDEIRLIKESLSKNINSSNSSGKDED
jgi:hypothetical protein